MVAGENSLSTKYGKFVMLNLATWSGGPGSDRALIPRAGVTLVGLEGEPGGFAKSDGAATASSPRRAARQFSSARRAPAQSGQSRPLTL